MAFPLTPLDVRTEIRVIGPTDVDAWVPITEEVRGTPQIVLTRGRPDEKARAIASTSDFVINNRAGRFSWRDPESEFYGFMRRYQQVRHYVVPGHTSGPASTLVDSFGRTVASGLGVADSGQTYSTFTGTAVTISVAAGAGIIHIVNANTTGGGYPDSATYSVKDSTQSITFTAPVPAGAALLVRLIARGSGTGTSAVRATCSLQTSGAIILTASDVGTIGDTFVVPDVTHTGTGQPLTFEARFIGHDIFMRVYVTSGGAPDDDEWHHMVTDTSADGNAGNVGFEITASTGTTGLPIDYSVRDYTVTPELTRLTGEFANLPQDWDKSGRDVWIPAQAAGALRGAGSTNRSLRSALTTFITTLSASNGHRPVFYWPLEDSTDATVAGAALGDIALSTFGTVDFSAVTGPAGSSSLPGSLVDDTGYLGAVGAEVAGSTIRVGFVFKIPTGAAAGHLFGFKINAAERIDVSWNGTGLAGATSGATIASWTPVDTDDGEYHFGIVYITTTNVQLFIDEVDTGSSFSLTSTATVLSGLVIAQNVADLSTGIVLGHFALSGPLVGTVFAPTGFTEAMNGYVGETAADRVARLAAIRGFTFDLVGTAADSATMGAQGIDSYNNLIYECAEADQGIVYETPNSLGLTYRTRTSLYSQTPTALLYTDLADVPRPSEDDALVKNDITVSRKDGGTVRLVANTVAAYGNLAVERIGTRDEDFRVNVETDAHVIDVAGWRRHLGTWDEGRYPFVPINLARASMVASPSKTVAVAQFEPGAVFTLTSTPSWLGPDLFTVMMQGCREVMWQYEWTLQFNTSPGGPWTVNILENTSRGRLDSADTVTIIPLDDNDTTIRTAVTGTTRTVGALWSTTQEPYEWNVGGEQIRVDTMTTTLPTFVAAGVVATAVNTSVTPALPAGVQAGDVLLINAGMRGSAVDGLEYPITPAGYTLLKRYINGALFGKYHTGTESAPLVSFSNSLANADTMAQMAAFRNLSLNLMDAQTGGLVSQQNITTPALTVYRNNCVIIYAGLKYDDWTSVAQVSGSTEIGEPDTTTGDDLGMTWSYLIQTTAVTVAAGTFTVTGGAVANGVGAAIALASDVQTATVTRSRNGVAKSQKTGERVRLYVPLRLAR